LPDKYEYTFLIYEIKGNKALWTIVTSRFGIRQKWV
jgi:hypothetical protein